MSLVVIPKLEIHKSVDVFLLKRKFLIKPDRDQEGHPSICVHLTNFDNWHLTDKAILHLYTQEDIKKDRELGATTATILLLYNIGLLFMGGLGDRFISALLPMIDHTTPLSSEYHNGFCFYWDYLAQRYTVELHSPDYYALGPMNVECQLIMEVLGYYLVNAIANQQIRDILIKICFKCINDT